MPESIPISRVIHTVAITSSPNVIDVPLIHSSTPRMLTRTSCDHTLFTSQECIVGFVPFVGCVYNAAVAVSSAPDNSFVGEFLWCEAVGKLKGLALGKIGPVWSALKCACKDHDFPFIPEVAPRVCPPVP